MAPLQDVSQPTSLLLQIGPCNEVARLSLVRGVPQPAEPASLYDFELAQAAVATARAVAQFEEREREQPARERHPTQDLRRGEGQWWADDGVHRDAVAGGCTAVHDAKRCKGGASALKPAVRSEAVLVWLGLCAGCWRCTARTLHSTEVLLPGRCTNPGACSRVRLKRRVTLFGLCWRPKAFTVAAWCCTALQLHTRAGQCLRSEPEDFMWASDYPLSLLSHDCNCRLVVDF